MTAEPRDPSSCSLSSMPRRAGTGGSGSTARLVVAAAQAARLDELKLLLQGGGDPNAVWRGYRPLHALIQERPRGETEPSPARMRCLAWLLDHGADPEQPGAWPPARAILVAAFVGAEPFVNRLREKGARIDAFVACAIGDAAAVRRELKGNPSFATARDGESLTSLQCCAASRLGRHDGSVAKRLLEIARALMDEGADPATKTKSWGHDIDALSLVVGAHNAEMLQLFLARGADATGALASAAWSRTEELMEITLAHGADVNRARAEGRPLLNEMVRWGRGKMVTWLLRHGADPNLPDERGWTAMHQAASRGNARMWNELVAAGGDLARTDGAGLTPPDVARVKRVVKVAKAMASRR